MPQDEFGNNLLFPYPEEQAKLTKEKMWPNLYKEAYNSVMRHPDTNVCMYDMDIGDDKYRCIRRDTSDKNTKMFPYPYGVMSKSTKILDGNIDRDNEGNLFERGYFKKQFMEYKQDQCVDLGALKKNNKCKHCNK